MKSAVVNGTNLAVGNYAFEYCYALESITFGEGVKSIGYRTCYQCGKISSLTLPDSLESIGNLAFPNLTATELHLGDSLKSIGSEAFANAKQLKTITIGKSLAAIDSTAFSGATALESITVDKDNPNYSDSDGVLMNKDKTALVLFPKSRQGQFIIPDTVTAIGDSTFDGCAGLTSVIVGDSVQTIGTRAFRSCSGLTEVTLGNGLTAIGNEAFYDCPKLQNEDFFVYNRIRSIKGDVNGDEEITISDVTLLQQYLADLETLDALGLAAADPNGDGIINISDATHIQKYIAEIITEM